MVVRRERNDATGGRLAPSRDLRAGTPLLVAVADVKARDAAAIDWLLASGESGMSTYRSYHRP